MEGFGIHTDYLLLLVRFITVTYQYVVKKPVFMRYSDIDCKALLINLYKAYLHF